MSHHRRPCLRQRRLTSRRTCSRGCALPTPTPTSNSKLEGISRTRSLAIAPRSSHTSSLVLSLLSSLFLPLPPRTAPPSSSNPPLPSVALPAALKLAFKLCSTSTLFLTCGVFPLIIMERLRMLVLVPLE